MPDKQKVNCTAGTREAGLGHAVLSASSSHRWLECPPSALLCSKAGDTASEFAMQGTDAHSLCEHKLKTALGQKSKDPTENLQYFDEEMADCSDMYAQYVMEQLEAAKEKCKDPIVLIEQHLDFSRWVPEGFGTGDCVIVSDETLTVIDFKYGVGILVEAEKNPQMMCYALGALQLFDGIYDIDSVSWAGDIKEYALQQAVSGKEWKDWKIVEGRSNRKYVNETAVADTVKDAGYDPYEHKVLGVTAMTKLLGRTRFEELLSGFIEKPQGKPTLVPMSDKRPAMNNSKAAEAADDFKEEN